MLINIPRLRGVTERLKIKVYDNVKVHFSKYFIEKKPYWICQHKRLCKIHGFQVLLLVLTKHLTKLQHQASIPGQKSGLKTA